MNLITPIIHRIFKPEGVQNTGSQRNLRLPESIAPQNAPDPIRQSDFVHEGRVGGFPSHHPLWLSFQPAMLPATWEEDRFGGAGSEDRLFTPNTGAWHIQGRQSEVGIRPNISRPPSIAYGSLFMLPGTPGA